MLNVFGGNSTFNAYSFNGLKILSKHNKSNFIYTYIYILSII